MKKKAALGGALLCYICVLCLTQVPENLFPDETIKSAEYAFRCIAISVLAALIVALTIFYMQNRKGILHLYLQKFKKYRPLLFQLVRRDFLAKYKRSVLGVLWSILSPLLTMIIMVIVFSYVFRFDVENFPVYVMSGQLIYTLFIESTNMAMTSVLSNAPLIKKIFVPKYLFPLSKMISALINMMFSLCALIIVMIFTKMQVYVTILMLLLPILYVFVFAVGIGMILSVFLVFFRDTAYLYSIFTFALSYFTPLFYPVSIIPESYRWIISMNPLYQYVELFREIVLYGTFPSLWKHIICILIALLSLMAGFYIFYKKQDDFILHI